ncbi:TPA: hypothetical protein MJD21_26340 [Klebsiella pneumoniae]|nr:hypothetical protein [Klebsiella pneumoniae]MBZ7543771.1 hypothetical protein [Klebsiella pneumoniae]HBX6253989.1 hypothetical protein [Klebsiella pneumoniae]HBY7581217.1 hypothetical protein [Klebsiella pneumoniae]HBZ1029499.1 hypothetical protein [Klebsiella pneumoniae]
MRDLILQLSKSSIYSTKPFKGRIFPSEYPPVAYVTNGAKLGLPQLRWSCLSQRAHDSSSK